MQVKTINMQVLFSLVLLLAFTGYSNAAYCVCKDGVGEQALQKAIDFACGAGAECSQIQTNGPCYQPNNLKSHCDFAVNSYFQKKGGGAQGSCDFSGAATLTNSPPSASGPCYSSSGGGTGTMPTPGVGTPTSTPTPNTGTGMSPPSMGTGTGSTGGTTTGNPSVFGPGSMGLGPTGSGTGFDSSGLGGSTALSAAFAGYLAMSFWLSHLVLMWA